MTKITHVSAKGKSMDQKVFEMAQKMDLRNIETQLALQCAPMITRLKTSNLLIVSNDNAELIKFILKKTEISYFKLFEAEKKTTFLLFHREQLNRYFEKDEVKKIFVSLGYRELELENLFIILRQRYELYMFEKKEFPHEIGLFLGYPVEDVRGFVEQKGKEFLHSGYWKVYENPEEKMRLFQKFEWAKKTLLQLISRGSSMIEIIDMYNGKESGNVVV